jgi:hypothetical protein
MINGIAMAARPKSAGSRSRERTGNIRNCSNRRKVLDADNAVIPKASFRSDKKISPKLQYTSMPCIHAYPIMRLGQDKASIFNSIKRSPAAYALDKGGQAPANALPVIGRKIR